MKLNPITIVRDWRRAHYLAEKIELALACLKRERPSVVGIDLDISDEMTWRAVQILLKPRGVSRSRYAISGVSRFPGRICLGYDERWGFNASMQEARKENVILAGGTPEADRWLEQREMSRGVLG